ncbi:MAG: HlyD family type I secretion periplasmic adaptor subunit [Methylococcaceae bacterium]|nr:HlyD family type I secretion periplasmic adaptor subunit [Methylococcaceae bacterium]
MSTSSSDVMALEQVDLGQRKIIIILLLSCVSFIIWAAISPLDIMSIANGTVKPASRVQTIQHLEGGIVRKLLVTEGEEVKQGQALIELESISSGTAYGEVFARVNSLTADLVRLETEARGDKVLIFDDAFSNANAELVGRTTSLFKARRSQLLSAMQSQREEMNIRTQAKREITTRIKHAVSRLKLVEEQITIEKKLLSNALSNRYEHIERLKEANRLKSDIAEAKDSVKKAQSSYEQAKRNLESIQAKYNEEVQTSISDLRRQLDESNQRLEKYKDSLARTTLRAPMDGIVKSLYVVTEGGVISPGGTVLDIVPGREGLIVEAQLAPQDVGHVQIGQQVFIQLASAEASYYGRIVGEVSHVSPDTLNTEDGQVYYVVRVSLKQEFFEKGGDRYKLLPGVMVTAGIIIGKRSVLDYILSPFIQTFPFVLSER